MQQLTFSISKQEDALLLILLGKRLGAMPLIDKISQNPVAYLFVKQLPTKRNWYRFALYKKNWKVVFKNLKSTLLFLGFFRKKQSSDKIRQMDKK